MSARNGYCDSLSSSGARHGPCAGAQSMTDQSSTPDAYARAGVDIAAGNEAVARYQTVLGAWRHPDQLDAIGGFGGVFRLPGGGDRALVASADGVGTKILIAAELQRYDGVGRDLVNHCVNDILVVNATPMFFLGLFCGWQTRSGGCGGGGGRLRACVSRAQLCAARRGNGGDAGAVCAGALRFGWNDRRHRGRQRRAAARKRGSR